MTKFLLRLFFRQLPDPADPASRGKIGIFSGIVGIFCNLLLFTGKLIVGLASVWQSVRRTRTIPTAMPGMNTFPGWPWLR